MNIFSGIVIFVLAWWMAFFCTLPFNIQSEKAASGNMPGAPVKHGLKGKAIVATAIACVLWLGIYAIIRSDIISFHDIAQHMAR